MKLMANPWRDPIRKCFNFIKRIFIYQDLLSGLMRLSITKEKLINYLMGGLHLIFFNKENEVIIQ